jgi:2-phospho-L-lactate guanylyltransferase (CobY/MobA/RfbA family)
MPATKEIFVVPLKRFDVAKDRLRRGGVPDVTSLARDLAAGVIRQCAPRHVVVLSESSDVTTFAYELGAEVLESDASNLNEAVQSAYEHLRGRCERVIVVHGDLQEPRGLGDYQPEAGITIVTDYLSRGTNVLVVPTGLDFHFHYGENSAQLHQAEAERLKLEWRRITDSPWRFDVDEPGDVQHP